MGEELIRELTRGFFQKLGESSIRSRSSIASWIFSGHRLFVTLATRPASDVTTRLFVARGRVRVQIYPPSYKFCYNHLVIMLDEMSKNWIRRNAELMVKGKDGVVAVRQSLMFYYQSFSGPAHTTELEDLLLENRDALAFCSRIDTSYESFNYAFLMATTLASFVIQSYAGGDDDRRLVTRLEKRAVQRLHESRLASEVCLHLTEFPDIRRRVRRSLRRLGFGDVCACCGKQESAEMRFHVCPGCHLVRYCSQMCRRNHLAVHAKNCEAVRCQRYN